MDMLAGREDPVELCISLAFRRRHRGGFKWGAKAPVRYPHVEGGPGNLETSSCCMGTALGEMLGWGGTPTRSQRRRPKVGSARMET